MKIRLSILAVVIVVASLYVGIGISLAFRTNSGNDEPPSSKQVLTNFGANKHRISTNNPVAVLPQSQEYTPLNLAPPAEAPDGGTHAAAVNNLGQVFGFADFKYPPLSYIPVLWNGAVPLILSPVPAGYHLAAYGGGGPDNSFINDSGTVVSLAANDAVVAQYPNDGRRPIIWQNGAPTILPLPRNPICTDFAARYGVTLDRVNSWPMGLNGHDHVLLLACEALWIWNGGDDPPLLAQQAQQGNQPALSPSIASSGNHLNDLDHAVLDNVVGPDPNSFGTLFVPAIYSLGSNTPLPFTLQPFLGSHTINNSDQVLAFYGSSPSSLGFWDGTQVVDLGQGGYASLNNLGTVVFQGGSPYGPRIYKDGVISPLNILGTSTGTGPLLINDAGQIAANYINLSTGSPYSVLYTPTLTPTSTPTPTPTPTPGATFTVTNINDSGAGSLRQSILDANGTPGTDTIAFNIPGSGTHTISPTSPLPQISDSIMIDGYTQPGASPNTLETGDNAVLLIEIDGTNAGTNIVGLQFTGGNSRVRGLVIDRFNAAGIRLDTIGGNVVEGNFLGASVDGTVALGNRTGVSIFCSHNLIGGQTPAARNIISGNSSGVFLLTVSASSNQVQGNYIGTNASGTVAIANGNGLSLGGGPNNLVGGTTSTARNVISGNGTGILIQNTDSSGNQVQGNFVGTNAAGTAALANAGNGIFIINAPDNTIGGSAAGSRNIISGNGHDGIVAASTSGISVLGNYIGTDVSGTVAIANDNGVNLSVNSSTIGGAAAGAGNLISGNRLNGILIFGDINNVNGNSNTVQGNYIGTNPAGSASLGNSQTGIVISRAKNNLIGGTATGARNLISGNTGQGVRMDTGATGNVVQGNFIGTNLHGNGVIGNASGITIMDSPTNTIGGTIAGSRNVISGNTYEAVHVEGGGATGNVVQGNFLGTDVTGTIALANSGGVGIRAASNNVIGGTLAEARNVISGNQLGMFIDTGATGNSVLGNFIGTNAAGTAALGNTNNGISISSPNNTIGGASAGAGNVISGNGFIGINISPNGSDGNLVQGNFIGTDLTGTTAIGNANAGVYINGGSNNLIGGTVAGARNVISGNGYVGVGIENGSTGNLVQGNFIGANTTGNAALPNASSGVEVNSASGNTIGGTSASARNLISGNRFNGVLITGTNAGGNVVQGNFIGTDGTGTSTLANLGSGIGISGSSNNLIGGLANGAANKIAFNNIHGVSVSSGTGNGLLSNSIFSNGGLGIGLAGGANNNQTSPLLNSVISFSGQTNFQGTISSTPNTALNLQFFANEACDPSGSGEGQVFLGSSSVTTDGSGAAILNATLPVAIGATQVVTATATDANNNTSAFSSCHAVIVAACADDTWTATSTTNAPTARTYQTAVWTGNEMIVWGGYNGSTFLNTGGRYNPGTGTWTPISTTNAPAARAWHTAVWTGSEMIVWGGFNSTGAYLNTGARYNPTSNTWTAISTTNAPAARAVQTAVWTGTEMIVWGGLNNSSSGVLNTGGRYRSSTNTWTAMSTTNAPEPRDFHTAVWTSSEMIVWGGSGNSGYLNTGSRYNPGTDVWTTVNMTNAPNARHRHAVVWTGREMIVWGGFNNISLWLNTGAKYDPSTDTWTAINTNHAPAARWLLNTAVWTGAEMIVWGGYGNSGILNSGGRYNPTTDAWTATSTTNAPAARAVNTAVWTGTEMIVWGGYGATSPLNTGARYCAGSSAFPTPTPTLRASSTTLTSSPNPSTAGQPVTFTASVTSASGTPTGSVEFFDYAQSLGAVSLSAGSASLTTAALTAGSHSITAVYSGDTNFLSSTSPVLIQTVAALTSVGSGVVVTETAGSTIVTITFSGVTVPGTVRITPIDPASAGTLPGGFILVGESIAFDISTTASFLGPVTVCFQAPSVTDPITFSNLRILHSAPKLDLATANSGSNNASVVLGNGAGSFTGATNFAVGSSPRSLAIGDFNRDGKPDLAVANYSSNSVSILLGDGSGGFAPAANFGVGGAPAGTGTGSIAVGDFNADGKQDLAVINYPTSGSPRVSILPGNGAGGFGPQTNFVVGNNPTSVVVGDFNGDGKIDLAVASYGNDVSMMLGNGAGGFSAPMRLNVTGLFYSLAVGDFNGDGKLDLAVANYGFCSGGKCGAVSILLGNGSGGFSSATNFMVGAGPVSIAAGDFNGDGKLDLVTANAFPNSVSILLGNGAGGFGPATNLATSSLSESVVVADFNNDLQLDLATANYSSNNISVRLGLGTGSFGAATNYPVGTNPYAVAVANFNRDVAVIDQTILFGPNAPNFTTKTICAQALSFSPFVIASALDQAAPQISNVSASPSIISPPDHKMIDVTISYDVSDDFTPAAEIVSALEVSSNEPVNTTGDGNTDPDIEIVDAHHVRLRAERTGNGSARVYTISIKAKDGAQNSSTKTVVVIVPKSQG